MTCKFKDVWFNSVIANAHVVEIDFIDDEEAIKAVEKLKAWQRLEDKGFKFKGLCESVYELPAIEYDTDVDVSRIDSQEYKDLNLLFGGEE